jgi:bifunctional UDP-N-acetylglucosamine pyrophosphorylase/glucosamine-1-phosphate N-acetyltransferase
LTDVVGLAAGDGILVTTQEAKDIWEIRGVNSRAELAELERHYQRRQAEALMDAGVSIADPDRFDVRGGAVTAGRDSHFDINVIIEGPARFGERVTIGANSVIKRTEIGDDVVIHPNCVIEDAVIGANSIVGPFARIRPGTRLDDRVHVGNFVEIKNSELAVGSKVNHLSYIGDSSIGRDVNVGAGVITCNYDGANKYRTIIEDGVFVGSDCQLIAPVSIGKGATVGAGSTITGDVPPDTLALARARQQHVSHWRRPRKKKN